MEQPTAESQYELIDIRSLLEEASSQLAVGEMIHTHDFDLFHVMSAVEIGDPRLDAGKSISCHRPSPKAFFDQVLKPFSRRHSFTDMHTPLGTFNPLLLVPTQSRMSTAQDGMPGDLTKIVLDDNLTIT